MVGGRCPFSPLSALVLLSTCGRVAQLLAGALHVSLNAYTSGQPILHHYCCWPPALCWSSAEHEQTAVAFPEHEAMSRQQRQSLIRSANHQMRGQAAKADARVRVEQSGVLRRIKVHVNVHGAGSSQHRQV